MHWNKVYFSTTFSVISTDSCHQFFQRTTFQLPETWNSKVWLQTQHNSLDIILLKRALSDRLVFSFVIRITSNCSNLELGISRANTIKNLIGFGFPTFCCFGPTCKHLIRFGVVKATFWCEFVKQRLLEEVFWFEALWHSRLIVF